MKSKSIALIIVLLILVSTLSVTVYAPQITTEDTVAEAWNETFSETLKINQVNSTYVDRFGRVIQDCSKQGEGADEVAREDKTLEDSRQTSRDLGNKWNFNDTSEWGNSTYVNGDKIRLIVGVNVERPTSLLELQKIAAKHQTKIVKTVSIGGEVRAVVVELLLVSVAAFVEEIHVAGLASYIEPNMKVQAQLVPNDPYWSMQWGPQKIEADWAWNITLGSHAVLVAVVDTGIAYTHPDLAANYVALGYDWVNNDADPMDDNGHGTHCAGIIAATLNNSVGIAGLAQVRVMAEKVLDSGGGGYWDWIANGIINATDCGADIISMSLGGYSPSELIHEAVRYAYDHGVLVVAAAGNDNTNMKLYPAGYDEVIAVAATDQWDNKAGFSNWGDWIELAAPGVDIYSTVPWGYVSWSGTSMATPHVSGAAALVWSRYPDKARDWVRLWLRYTADDLGAPGFDVYYGYGRVNARNAVEHAPPAHELIAYGWETPPYVEPGASAVINATVLNFGENNETDVAVQLLANDTLVDSTVIGFLVSGGVAEISLTWNPAVEGLYNLTLYVVPVLGETNVENNVLRKFIYVGIPLKAVVLHSAGNVVSEIITNWQVLNTEWRQFGNTMIYIDYAALNKDDITYEDIAATEADVMIISCASSPEMGWEFTDAEIQAIKQYAEEGHGLIITSGTLYSRVPNNNKLGPVVGLNETTVWDATQTDLLHLLNTTHPLFRNVPNPFIFPDVGTVIPFDRQWDSNELVGGTYLALGEFKEGAIVVRRGLLFISPILEFIPAYYHHHLQLLYNAVTWSRYQKPQHELKASLETPQALKPNTSALLNATVSNLGLSNETSVELQLLINSVVVNSATIPLLAGESYTLSHLWTPTVEGSYNITAFVVPVPGEDDVTNNIKSVRVLVSTLLVALFQNGDPWEYPSDQEALDRYSVPYVLFSSRDFGRVDLSAFTKVVIASDQDQAFYNGMDAYRWWFEDYVSLGGVLEIHAADWGWHGGQWVGPLPGGLQWASYYGQYVTVVDPTHPLLTTPNTITDAELDNWNYAVHGYFSVYPADAHVIIIEDSTRMPAYLEFGYGSGFIIASSQTLEWAYKLQLSLILENSLLYTPIKYEHNLAVTLKAPAFLEPGASILLNATVRNRGLKSETSVELRLLINDTVVDSIVIPELLAEANYTLSYLWTPTIKGVYNVTAYAPPVPDEEYTRNNIASVNVWVRYVIARVAVLNSWEIPPYFTGGWSNNYQTLVDALNAEGFYAQAVTNEEIIGGTLSFFDVFVMVDNVPNDAAVPCVVDFSFNGGGIVAFDSSICFLCYAGILPPESAGSNGYYVYWDYETSYQARIAAEHPITEGYEFGQIINGTSGDAEYRVDALAGTSTNPYYTMLVEDVTRPSRAYVSAYEPPTNGKVVHIWDQYHWSNTNLQLMILNAMEWAVAPIYEHDLSVTLDAPSFLGLGESTLLNATVTNRGLNNETNVELQLLLNGTIVSSVLIPEFLKDASYTLNYPWIPKERGFYYNVTAYALPVPGENLTLNNHVTKMVYISMYTRIYLPPEWISGGVPMGWQADDGSWSYALPFDFPFYDIYYRTIYISSNGLITFVGPDASLDNSIPALAGKLAIAPAWDDWMTNQRPGDDIYIWQPDPVHIIIRWQVVAYYNPGIEANFEVILSSNGTIQFNYGSNNGPISSTIGISNGAGDFLAEDATNLSYIHTIVFSMRYEHELAVSLDVPAFLELGNSTLINATVRNVGLNNETIVELYLLINDTTVSSTLIDFLEVGAYCTLSYEWNPTVEGMYNVTAYVPPLLSEVIASNNVESAFVTVAHLPIVYVNPPMSRASLGEPFTVDVSVANVSGLCGYEFQLSFDPEILECLEVTLGVFFPSSPRSFSFFRINNTIGVILFAAVLIPPETSKNGSGTLATMIFNATAEGTSLLDLHDTKLGNMKAEPIAHKTFDGIVNVKLMGDVNGDGIVDVFDLIKVGIAFGSKPGDPNWNPNADLREDNLIDVFDLIKVAIHFGEKYP